VSGMNVFRATMFAVGLMVVAVIAPAAAQNVDEPDTFLLAIQGTVVGVGDGELTMRVPALAVVFADRPERLVFPVDLADFLERAWDENAQFQQIPPNASLVDETHAQIGVIEIYEMLIDQPEPNGEGELTIHFGVLDGDAPLIDDRIALTIENVDGALVVPPRTE
jgi:hypothetical protein